MLREQPAVHLLALWEGALFDKCTARRRDDEERRDWEMRKRTDAAELAAQLLIDLCNLSLLQVTEDDVPR